MWRSSHVQMTVLQSGPPRYPVLTIFQSPSSVIFPEPYEWQNRNVPFVVESRHVFAALWSASVSELTATNCTDTFLWEELAKREGIGWMDSRREKGVEEGIINTKEVWESHMQSHYFYKLHIYIFVFYNTCIDICIEVLELPYIRDSIPKI